MVITDGSKKINTLLLRTTWFTKQMDALNIEYFRDPFMNIVTLKSEYIPENIAHKFGLVPDTHNGKNSWYKVIMMDHVEIDDLIIFVEELQKELIPLEIH